MCESADISPTLQEGLVHFFLDRKAGAVLGTECLMTVNFAHAFSEFILRQVISGAQVAFALREARREFLRRRNPLGLAYSLYGSGTLQFLPGRFSDKAQKQTANEVL